MLEAELLRPRLQQHGAEPDAFEVKGLSPRATDSVYWGVRGLSFFLQGRIQS